MFKLFKKTVINNIGIKRLIKTYAKEDNWHQMDISTGNLGYGWIHYALIRNLKPKKVLCIGSKYGYIPAVCATACRDNKIGMVDFVDASLDINDYTGPGEHWGGVGFWKKCNPQRYFGKFKIEKHINLHVMTSQKFAKKFAKTEYDYIYLDGDHSYEGVKSDFNLFWPKLSKNGFLSIHDIASQNKDGNIYGTRDFWSELKKDKKIAFEFNQDPGLGVIQKL